MRYASSLIALVCLLAVGCGDTPASPSPLVLPSPVAATLGRISLVPAQGDLPIGGGSTVVHVETSNSGGGVPVANVAVTLSASTGKLEATSLTTDSTGHARVTWTGTETATITATAGEVNGTVQVNVATPFVPPPTPPQPTRPPATVVATISPTAAIIDQPVTFAVSLTTSSGSVPAVRQYTWTGAQPADAARPSATFTATGSYPVSVAVRLADGRTIEASATVVVGLPQLTGSLNGPDSLGLNAQGVFTVQNLSLRAGETVRMVSWDFEDGAADDATTTGLAIAFAGYTTHGNKTVQATVETSLGRTVTLSTRVVVVSQ
jgi:hypothetical protein